VICTFEKQPLLQAFIDQFYTKDLPQATYLEILGAYQSSSGETYSVDFHVLPFPRAHSLWSLSGIIDSLALHKTTKASFVLCGLRLANMLVAYVNSESDDIESSSSQLPRSQNIGFTHHSSFCPKGKSIADLPLSCLWLKYSSTTPSH
jgi:hypothetical protein